MAMKVHLHEKRGVDLLHDPRLNKGTAFTDAERDALGLSGLLPPRVTTQAMQVERVLGNIRRKPDDLEKYIYLVSLQERNEAPVIATVSPKTPNTTVAWMPRK
jgi:malate dehydrogenase (oxaloacetate-decarboxylating)(NADP+)